MGSQVNEFKRNQKNVNKGGRQKNRSPNLFGTLGMSLHRDSSNSSHKGETDRHLLDVLSQVQLEKKRTFLGFTQTQEQKQRHTDDSH